MTTVSAIKSQTEYKMKRTIETLAGEFTRLRTGRASVGILESVTVEYYGTPMPLSQVANLGVADPRTLSVQPWDRKMIPVIEKAILASNLGLNPAASGDMIRVPIPPLNEERRRELTKVVRSEGEDSKVAIRNLRRDAISGIKKLEDAKEISEDEQDRAEKEIQKLTDKYIDEVDGLVARKEKEVMTV